MGLTETSFDGHAEKSHDAFVTIQEQIRKNREGEAEPAEIQFAQPPETIATSETETLKQQLSIAQDQCKDYYRLTSDDTELAKFLQMNFGAEPEWKQDKFRGDSTGAIAIYFLRRGTRPSMFWKLRRWLGW